MLMLSNEQTPTDTKCDSATVRVALGVTCYMLLFPLS